ncbi:efflux transporter outer membrane subunit [Paraglaciecola aestuariivivens]
MRKFSYLFIAISLSACQAKMSFPSADMDQHAPANWIAQPQLDQQAQSSDSWYQSYANPELDALITRALSHNPELQKQALAVKIAEKQLDNQQAQLWPTLGLNINASRSQSQTSLSSGHGVSLSGSYEIDLWGKLGAQAQAQAYQLLASQAQYQQAKQSLIGEVFSLYTQILEAKALLALFEQRAKNAEQSQMIIESGYQQGLNSALDVYLARNQLHSDRAKVTAQLQTTKNLTRQLEKALGFYPESALSFNQNMPTLSDDLSTGLPADIAKNNPKVKMAWLNMLQANELVAVAHKQRFPSFTLTSSLGKSSEDISQLFSSDLIWSVVGSVVTPLFNAGKLANNQDIADFTAQQAELDYLDTLREVFFSVENALYLESNLATRIHDFATAKDNAQAAEQLAFEQYQKGLVDYTTVLEAQTRAVDAQSSLIQLQSELITNRINLHLALGSGFNFLTSEKMDANE